MSLNLSRKRGITKEYLEAQITNKEHRINKVAKLTLKEFKDEFGTCWQCWMDLTGKGLDDWREKYSEAKDHPKECSLCGYDHWKGRVWYPFKFLRNEGVSNPSRRDSKDYMDHLLTRIKKVEGKKK